MKKKISAGKQKGGKSAALLIAGMVAATLLMSMLCAALMEKGSIPEERTNLSACVIVGLVSLLSCGGRVAGSGEKAAARDAWGGHLCCASCSEQSVVLWRRLCGGSAALHEHSVGRCARKHPWQSA